MSQIPESTYLRASKSDSRTWLQPSGSQPRSLARRELGEQRVDLIPGESGQCQIHNSLDTLYVGQTTAAGMMFTLTAKDNIEVLAFEFANFRSNQGLVAEIYTRAGSDYVSVADQSSEWELLLDSTTPVESLDGLGSIAPTAQMKKAVSMNQGETRSFYITLQSPHLQVQGDSGLTSGQAQLSDDLLQLNVGHSLRFYPFSSELDENMAFQGKVHYRAFKTCSLLETSTEVHYQFAVTNGADIRDINQAFTNGFVEMLKEEAKLSRWTEIHGLRLDSVQLKERGNPSGCSEHGFSNGCLLIDGTYSFKHYESLTSKQLTLEMMSNFIQRNGIGAVSDDFEVKYIGDKVLIKNFIISLQGLPERTVLNPFQREYISEVTFSFLEEYSSEVPYLVDTQSASRRMLRNSGNATSSRHLQTSNGRVQLKAAIYGIGDNQKAFRESLEKAFRDNSKRYQQQLVKQQYLPGEINEDANYGAIFEDIRQASVQRIAGNETEEGLSDGLGQSPQDIQIIVFSCIAGVSFLFLVYRFARDCLMVESGATFKKKKVKNNEVKKENAREELAHMEESPKRRATKSLSFSGIDAFNALLAKNNTAGRQEPESRGVNRAKSADDLDLFTDDTDTTGGTSEGRGRAAPAKRGIGIAKSFDDLGFMTNAAAQKKRPSSTRTATPSRGVARSNTFSGVEAFFGANKAKDDSSTSKNSRGVTRTKSADDVDLFGGLFGNGKKDNGTGKLPRRGSSDNIDVLGSKDGGKFPRRGSKDNVDILKDGESGKLPRRGSKDSIDVLGLNKKKKKKRKKTKKTPRSSSDISNKSGGTGSAHSKQHSVRSQRSSVSATPTPPESAKSEKSKTRKSPKAGKKSPKTTRKGPPRPPRPPKSETRPVRVSMAGATGAAS